MQNCRHDHARRCDEAAQFSCYVWSHRDSHGWTIELVTNTTAPLAAHSLLVAPSHHLLFQPPPHSVFLQIALKKHT